MNKQKGLAPLVIIILIAMAVGGILIYQKQIKPVSAPQPSPSPVSSPVASNSAETVYTEASRSANWKTYTNEVYGYSIGYPSDWINANDCQGCKDNDPINDKTGRIFNPGKNDGTGIDLEISSNRATSFIIMSNVIKGYSLKNQTIENIKVDGIEAVKVSGIDYNTKRNVAVVFERNGYVYKMQTWLDYADIFDKMLSTFKFLP